MGGDGGVIASNRKYVSDKYDKVLWVDAKLNVGLTAGRLFLIQMRGAGTADHTGDAGHKTGFVDPAVEKEELRRTMSTCAISGEPLRFGKETIVACPYGRLYHKEAAVKALIKRKQEESDTIGPHVRGLKDLKEVRFHLTTSADGTTVPVCPIRGSELNGQIPAIALIPGGTVNVISEKALKEMGSEILEEYGPSKKTLKLAPTTAQLKEIQGRRKSSKKGPEESSGKRKRDADKVGSTLGDEIRSRVTSKVKKSEVLSSLFKSTGGTTAVEGSK